MKDRKGEEGMKDEKEAKSAPGIVQGQINPAEATPCEGSAASPQPAAEQEQYDEIDAFEDAFERYMDWLEDCWCTDRFNASCGHGGEATGVK